MTSTPCLPSALKPAAVDASLQTSLCYGYSREQLQQAFDVIVACGAHPEDWRAPISSFVRVENPLDARDLMLLLDAAVRFFTATDPISVVVMHDEAPAVHVRAAGYRAGPAGP